MSANGPVVVATAKTASSARPASARCARALIARRDAARGGDDAAARPGAPEQRDHHEPEEPRDVEVEPVRHGELQREQDRGGARGQADEVAPPRDERERQREQRRAATCADALGDVQPLDVGVVQAPDRERRAALGLEGDRVIPEAAPGRSARAAAGTPATPRSPKPAAYASSVRGRRPPCVANSGASASGANFVSAAQRDERAARRRAARGPHRGEHEHRHERVVGVGHERVERERVRHPGVGEQHAEVGPAHAPADEEQQQAGEQVEGDRGGVRRRQVVPAPAPRRRLLEGHVGEVDDRAVRVAAGVVAREGAVQRRCRRRSGRRRSRPRSRRR